ncbi:MAG: NAD+ synthase [Candidatus Latescibacter sp.]|nr:NAD+ synthase [Candidatus Latescibacter sp.]
MRQIRITLAQINTTVGDLDGNVARCLDAAGKARENGSDLVVFPELALSGYPPEDLLLRPGFLRGCRKALEKFAAGAGEICAIVGLPDGLGPVYNAAAVVSGGKVHCIYHKMFLPNYGVFDEKRYFLPGRDPLSFRLGDVTVGMTICEDIWVEEGRDGARSVCTVLSAVHRADVIINISASPYNAGKLHDRTELLAERTTETDTPIVYVNLIGGQDELVFDGGSLVFDRKGNCILKAPSFTEYLAVIDLEFENPLREGSAPCFKIPKRPEPQRSRVKPIIAPPLSEEEEIMEALVLGTRDYIRKNGFSKVVIGLSGGIDSSIVACVAAEALGRENVIGVTMPSQFTSTGTRSDAEILAMNLKIRFIEIPIGEVFTAFIQSLSDAFRDTRPDVTEENLQARIRGTLLMSLSNKFGWLVLTTGNKSEVATGYCTLYGDTAGGFAVIKDVPKIMVYRLARLINTRAAGEIIPETVIARPPSAELRPDQKDSDSLPPYDILDPILKDYIEQDMGVEEIVAHGFDRETVKRVVRMCDLAEYKRRQAPPGVKITPRAFGRDRRLPITNRFRDTGNEAKQKTEDHT